jgi:hypothetical protein
VFLHAKAFVVELYTQYIMNVLGLVMSVLHCSSSQLSFFAIVIKRIVHSGRCVSLPLTAFFVNDNLSIIEPDDI